MSSLNNCKYKLNVSNNNSTRESPGKADRRHPTFVFVCVRIMRNSLTENVWLVETDSRGNLTNQRFAITPDGVTIGTHEPIIVVMTLLTTLGRDAQHSLRLNFEGISSFHAEIKHDSVYDTVTFYTTQR